jgi:hypothetical protein
MEIVFCIDCSGSMGPVIETAKQKVWAIVNELARAKPTPTLRVGLLGYGQGDSQWRRFDLSDDLDEVYKNLNTFKDERWGNEWVGRAIDRATREMSWTPGTKDLKVIYVLGNETARQGPPEFDYAKTAPAAIGAGIVVNAIYCGSAGGEETWQEFARLADGQYLAIAGSGGAVVVQSPVDSKLEALNVRLNATYLPYGVAGREGLANQSLQDANAKRVGGAGVAAERIAAKASVFYRNARWDLVDAVKEKDFDWKKVKDEDLPAEMRKMTLQQRKAHVEKMAKERAAVQAEILTLTAERDRYVQEEIRKQGLTGDKAFDTAVRKSIVEQAQKKGYQFR